MKAFVVAFFFVSLFASGLYSLSERNKAKEKAYNFNNQKRILYRDSFQFASKKFNEYLDSSYQILFKLHNTDRVDSIREFWLTEESRFQDSSNVYHNKLYHENN